MADESDGTHETEPSTAVFELVGQETRAAILAALAAHAREEPETAASFSTLRHRVGHDDPGNFNYHLQRLVGGPVERTADGYELSHVGQRLVGLLLSDRSNPDATTTVESRVACPVCGASSSLQYAGGALRLTCADHGAVLDVGPGVVARHGSTTACRLGLRRGLFDTAMARAGVCTACEGRMVGGLRERDERVVYEAICRRCGCRLSNIPGGCVLDHPAVVSLCYEAGLDVRTDGWRVLVEHTDWEILDREPLVVAVRVTVGDASVRLRLDASGTVTGVTHSW